MPIGLIFMKWNEITGNEILTKYPEAVEITDRNLMQIFDTHDFSGEKGLISLMVGSLNIISWYSGPDTNYCITLLLDIDDDPDDYQDGLSEVSQIILQNLEDDVYIDIIPSLYQKIVQYPSLTFEQKLAVTYNNEIKRSLLIQLREEGVILKSDLTDWLQERYLKGFGDLDTILFELVQKEIIEIISVKGERSLVIFFINDINMFRVPPFKLLKNSQESGLPNKLHKTYVIDSQDFFNNYTISELDNLEVVERLINPQFYEILSLLRKGAIIKKKNERLSAKNRDIIRILEKSKMVKSYIDTEGNVYYALISDFYINFYIPQYILSIIKMAHNNNLKSNEVLFKYLDLLENVSNDLIKKSKSK